MLGTIGTKSPVERKRTFVTWLLAPAWLTILIATQPEGFETLGYSLIEFLGFFLVFAAVLGRLWCTLYIGGRKDLDLSPPNFLQILVESATTRRRTN